MFGLGVANFGGEGAQVAHPLVHHAAILERQEAIAQLLAAPTLDASGVPLNRSFSGPITAALLSQEAHCVFAVRSHSTLLPLLLGMKAF